MIQYINLESFAAILTLICVFLAAKNNLLNWPISIVATILYLLVFIECRLYSDALLQVVFILFQIYGWYNWKKVQNGHDYKGIRTLNIGNWFFTILASLILWWIWYNLYLKIAQNPKYPLIDSGLTIFSLTAIYLQAKKYLENWILWIAVDLVYVPMYYYAEKYQTSVLYSILILLSIKGYIDWKKTKKMAT